MNNKVSKSLENILAFFPEIDPPVTISEESILTFSSKNKPLAAAIIAEHFVNWEEFDEFTEVIPCFQIPTEGDFKAIVYWKGSLLSYEYILLTLDLQGNSIAKKVIAGMISNGQTIIRSVARLDEDLCIYSMTGEKTLKASNYDPDNSNAHRFEILPDGTIGSNQEDRLLWEEEKQERKN